MSNSEKEKDLSEDTLGQPRNVSRGSNMKWFDRALSAAIAGALAIIAIQILYAKVQGYINETSITLSSFAIMIAAVYLFYLGYKGRSPRF